MNNAWIYYIGAVAIWGAVLFPAPVDHSFTTLVAACALALHHTGGAGQ